MIATFANGNIMPRLRWKTIIVVLPRIQIVYVAGGDLKTNKRVIW